MARVTKAVGAPRRRRSGKSGKHLLSTFGNTRAEQRELKARKEAAFMRRARLSKRDQDYARSPYAPRVTVEERELANSELGTIMRIETRGQRVIGWRAAGHVSHN